MGEQFKKLFPFYLSIGMSYTEYWEGAPALTRYYREAYKERQKQKDYDAWLQGAYIFDGVSTALSNILAKNKSDVRGYVKEPYSVKADKEYQRQQEEKQKELEMKKFENWLVQLQQMFKG